MSNVTSKSWWGQNFPESIRQISNSIEENIQKSKEARINGVNNIKHSDAPARSNNNIKYIEDKITGLNKFIARLNLGNVSIEDINEHKATAVRINNFVKNMNRNLYNDEEVAKLDSFGVEIDKIINSLDSYTDNKPAGGIKVNNKVINKIKKKTNYMNTLFSKLQNAENLANDINNILSNCEATRQMILSIDPTTCSEDEIAELNSVTNILCNIKKQTEDIKASTKDNNKTIIASNNTSVQEVQSSAAAHNLGFNINNFIKQQPTIMPNVLQQQQPKPTVFPHQICGLTDEQITDVVSKHFKVLETLPVYPLYDLLNNKYLAHKMKEFNCKHRPNNPYLIQVNMNEYIDVPELLDKYKLCFTMPCHDKGYIIVVLFNTNPVPNKDGLLQYPLHVLKAKLNNNK